MIGETSISFIVDRHINKEDPLFELAKREIKNIKKYFEKHTRFCLKLKKYDIFKQPDGKSKVVGICEIYETKKRKED